MPNLADIKDFLGNYILGGNFSQYKSGKATRDLLGMIQGEGGLGVGPPPGMTEGPAGTTTFEGPAMPSPGGGLGGPLGGAINLPSVGITRPEIMKSPEYLDYLGAAGGLTKHLTPAAQPVQAAQKPRPTRTRQKGRTRIFEAFDSSTGTWTEVSRGPMDASTGKGGKAEKTEQDALKFMRESRAKISAIYAKNFPATSYGKSQEERNFLDLSNEDQNYVESVHAEISSLKKQYPSLFKIRPSEGGIEDTEEKPTTQKGWWAWIKRMVGGDEVVAAPAGGGGMTKSKADFTWVPGKGLE